tara:strand:+ start:7624 stop:8649 length:1026 start_codon:yes stop_codon:yes gene_type:complete
MAEKKSVLNIVSLSRGGHRAMYEDFISKYYSVKVLRSGFTVRPKEQVFFLMVEESFIGYFLSCVLRSFLGRETSGLLFNPKGALESSSLKSILKRLALKFLKINPFVRTFTILPHAIEPNFSKISDGYIYDFQFWDLSAKQLQEFRNYKTELATSNKGDLRSQLMTFAEGRKVILSLGRQSKIKGIDNLVNAALSLSPENLCIVIAGKQDEYARTRLGRISSENLLCIDRFITDAELFDLYSSSDFVWCCYDDSYDQSSGIFGRASQLGICSIIRASSYIHKLALIENFPHIALDDSVELEKEISKFHERCNPNNGASDNFSKVSLSTLKDAIHVMPSQNK